MDLAPLHFIFNPSFLPHTQTDSPLGLEPKIV